nr:winged helix-turn-helix domain-containing protein [Haloarcula rubripromontorii]
MSKSTNGRTAPKSMRHKQILDVAAENPEASIAELAAEVPSATAELVERVLEEHGDPAETDETDAAPSESSAESQPHPTPEDLSSTERETLRAIRQHPTASQRDLAEKLDVTASTVSNRVNGIDGFDWANRETFANAVFSDEKTDSTPSDEGEALASESASPESPDTPDERDEHVSEPDTASDDGDRSAAVVETAAGEVNTTLTTFQSTVEDLSAQLAELEGQVETIADGGGSLQSDPFQDPELVHKVVHACMNSENISEEEELQILESLL